MKFRFSLLLMLCFTNFAYSNLEDYFKKAEDKSDFHQLPNVDFIYMINLDQRPEKWLMSALQLAQYGIYPYRFSAVNGWELPLEAINDVGLKYQIGMDGGFMATSYKMDGDFKPSHELVEVEGQTYFCHCTARGTIGIILSHLSVLQDAYDAGYKTIWVMEDDVSVISDPRKISLLIDELDQVTGKENWDVLFTDRDIRDANGNYVPAYGMARRPNFKPKDLSQYLVRKDINSSFTKIGARFGAHSMILRRSGIKKILNFFKLYQLYLPYDMDFYLPVGIKLYAVKNDIVSNTPKAVSDNGGPAYLNKK